LIIAAGLVDADSTKYENLVAVLQADRRAALPLPKEGRANLRRIVFQAEINVAGGRLGDIRNLARRLSWLTVIAPAIAFAWPESSMFASITKPAKLLPKISSAYN
jgi:hypothetical protein